MQPRPPIERLRESLADNVSSAWGAEDGRGVTVHGRAGRSPFSGRALLHDAAHVAGFFPGSGGSSITQQLARNIYVDPAERSDRSLSRKLKETAIALELKRRYTNRQILEWYLNQVYYGHSAYGAEAAARLYFGKTAEDLTLAEAALVAGLPQAPGEYSPAVVENREQAKARQLQVLDLMRDHAGGIGKIGSAKAE